MKKQCYILVTFLVFSWFSTAQNANFPFVNFSEKDGLPEKFIYSITQDANGMLWIGTGSGLYQFNGIYFTKFNSDKDQSGHQINNVLHNVFKDYDGKLWLSSLNAIQIFDPKSNVFSSLNYNKKGIDDLLKSVPNGFFRDSNKKMWIATQTNFWYLYNEKSKTATQIIPQSKYLTQESRNIVKFIETPNKKVWVISTNGLFEIDINKKVTAHFNLENEKPLKNTFFDGYFDQKRNCIWLAAGFNGIAKFDLTTQKFQYKLLIDKKSKNSIQANYVNLIAKKNENEIWFASSLLGSFTISDGSFSICQPTYKDDYSFKTFPISRFFNDKENNLWICSFNGLAQLPWQNNQVATIPLYNPIAKYTVEPFGVIAYKDTDLLIANNASNGLLWWKSASKTLSVIENPFYKNKPKELQGIHALAKNSKGVIYGVGENNLFVLNQESNQLIPVVCKDQFGKSIIEVTNIVVDDKDNLYMSSYNNGFYFYNPKTTTLTHYNLKDVYANNKTSNAISASLKDSQNNIWFTETEGVYCKNKATGSFIHFAYGKAQNTKAKILKSMAIAEDKNGHFWITTIDNGIFELDIKGKQSKLYNYTKENSGLPSDYCVNLVCDTSGFLWIGTLNGLVKFDTKTKKTVSVLNKQNGLYDVGISVMINLLPNGNLVINHYGNLSVFNVNKYKTNTLKPTVHLTSIKVLDTYIDSKTIEKKSLKLKYNQNFITFEFASNVMNNANQNKFAYKLDGIDKDWVETNKNSVTYSGLSNGDYIFLVKAVNNDGVWGNVSRFDIAIQAPFWKVWWFYGLLLIAIIAILFWLYTFKLKQVKKEEAIKSQFAQQIAEIEMKALRAQMNPHFIFNSMNSIQKFILKNDSFSASQYLTKFSKLIRLILDNSNQNYISLESEIALLKLYIEIEDLRFDNQFEYEIKIDDSLNTEAVQIPSMIIQPYIENAIWHGLLHKETKGKLTLEITKLDDAMIKVVVSDDGIGRQKALELKSKQILKRKSYGLQITEDRIDILNKTKSNKTQLQIFDLKDEEGNPTGTKIELIIPIQSIN